MPSECLLLTPSESALMLKDDRAAERLWLAEQLGRLVDALTASFLEERRGRAWTKTVATKKWMAA
jgi:hypothetical protein